MKILLTIVAFAGLVLAAIYGNRWETLLLLAVWLTVGWFAGRQFRRDLEEGVSRSRGFVLREATVATEDVKREPVDDLNLSLQIELTITPRPGNAQVRPWRPDLLRLHLPESATAVEADSIEIRDSSGWSNRASAPVKGEQRVRLKLSVPSKAARLDLRYYLEELAGIDLVPVEPAPAVSRKRRA